MNDEKPCDGSSITEILDGELSNDNNKNLKNVPDNKEVDTSDFLKGSIPLGPGDYNIHDEQVVDLGIDNDDGEKKKFEKIYKNCKNL